MIRKTGKERTRLETVIPLDTPFVLHIEVTSACNFNCKFCSFSDDEVLKQLGIKRGFMDFDLFCKIIDDLKQFKNKIKLLQFHVGGEPLLHKDIVRMIAYAHKEGVAEELMLTTNGSLLTPELARAILKAGLNKIQISVEAVNDEKYKELTGRDISYNQIVGNVAYLYAYKEKDVFLNVKILDCGLSEQEKEKFYEDFTPIATECHIEHLMQTMDEDIKDTTLGFGYKVTNDGYALSECEVCTQPFYTMAINYNGSVSPCVCDWSRKLIVGDVTKQSVLEIWNGERYQELRKMQLKKARLKSDVCGKCNAIKNQLDDIDAYAEELLKRI